jgi:hypothetical protein
VAKLYRAPGQEPRTAVDYTLLDTAWTALRTWASKKTSGLGYSLSLSGARLCGSITLNFQPFFVPKRLPASKRTASNKVAIDTVHTPQAPQQTDLMPSLAVLQDIAAATVVGAAEERKQQQQQEQQQAAALQDAAAVAVPDDGDVHRSSSCSSGGTDAHYEDVDGLADVDTDLEGCAAADGGGV